MKFNKIQKPKDLFVLFILLIVASLIIISGSTLINVRKTIDRSSERYVTSVGETVYAKTLGYLKPISLLNEIIFDVKVVGPDFIHNINTMNRLGKSFLTAYPQLQSFIAGNEKGEFYLLKMNANKTYSQRIISPQSKTDKTIDSVLDSNLATMSQSTLNTSDFDPRLRPWYKGAKYAINNFWTSLYIFYMDNTPGLTISHAFQDSQHNFNGAFGFDINIYGLSEFLRQLESINEGHIMIINNQNQIVAYNKPDQIFNSRNTYVSVPFSDFEDGLFYDVLEASKNNKGIVAYKKGSTRYISLIKSLEPDLGVPWKIIIIYPLKIFLKPFQLTLYFVFATTVFSILLLSFLFIYRYREIKATEKLIYYANHDQLTQLHNRHYYTTHYQSYFTSTVQDFALILADIDHFKVINDTYGHSSGDLVLIHIAALIRKRLGDDQVAIRWGGEEFLIILENQSTKDAVALSESLRQDLHDNRIRLDGEPIPITMSFGVAACVHHAGFKETIHRADEKLYEAKSHGRDQIRS